MSTVRGITGGSRCRGMLARGNSATTSAESIQPMPTSGAGDFLYTVRALKSDIFGRLEEVKPSGDAERARARVRHS